MYTFQDVEKVRLFRTAQFVVLGIYFTGLLGCSLTSAGTVSSSLPQPVLIKGIVHGGQQPVSGSMIQLYSAGKGGNQSDATPLLTTPVITGADGGFSITGDYTCPSTDSLVYIVSTGGNPGLASGTNNAALVMMAALGDCTSLTAATNIFINERTTVAAAWALAPFMAQASNIGSSATNYSLGLRNAFLNTQLLVNSSTGGVATTGANLMVESGKINALADALASCVNSDGGSACSPLMSAATIGSSTPKDTLSAALNIVKNPGHNAGLVFNCVTPTSPFTTTLTQAPSDWTMSMSITGGGLQAPTALGIDSYGNIWVANYAGSVSAFSPQGVPYSATGYGSAALSETYGLTIDAANNIWATNEESPKHGTARGSITKIFGADSGANMGSVAIASIYETYTNYPEALAADSNGDIAVANFAGGTASLFDSNGGTVASGLGSGYASGPSALAVDTAHGVWLANNDNTITHIDSTGTILSRPTCCARAQGIALDSSANVWVTDYLGSSLTELASNGNTLLTVVQGGGVDYPGGIAVDAAQDVWVANYHGNSFSVFSGGNGGSSSGAALSPSTGFGKDSTVVSSNGVISSLLLPYAIQPDASGNVWVSAFASNDLVVFFGLATPTKTPLIITPSIP